MCLNHDEITRDAIAFASLILKVYKKYEGDKDKTESIPNIKVGEE